MVCEARATGNTCVTGVAGRYWALPSCEAVITHWPAVQGTTVAPETAHTRWFFELYDTARPVGEVGPSNTCVHDDAVKTTGTPTVAPATPPNMICSAERTGLPGNCNDRAAEGAGGGGGGGGGRGGGGGGGGGGRGGWAACAAGAMSWSPVPRTT